MGRTYTVEFKFTRHWYREISVKAPSQKEAMRKVRDEDLMEEQIWEMMEEVNSDMEDENSGFIPIKATRIKEKNNESI